jgi:hypothetical protein
MIPLFLEYRTSMDGVIDFTLFNDALSAVNVVQLQIKSENKWYVGIWKEAIMAYLGFMPFGVLF